jgi:hypothetical protein
VALWCGMRGRCDWDATVTTSLNARARPSPEAAKTAPRIDMRTAASAFWRLRASSQASSLSRPHPRKSEAQVL